MRVKLDHPRTQVDWLKRSIVALSCCVGIAIVASAQRRDKSASPADAKETFETICASCHGLDGRGGERGPDLVSRAEVVAKTDAELGRTLREGKTAAGMPSFGGLGANRIAALVGYLRSLQGGTKTERLPGNPAQGKTLFFGKAKCGDCHMVGGQGGFFGQDLSKYAGKRSAEDIRAAIVNPNKDLDPRRGLVTVEFADSSRLSGLARNEDNFSLQLQTADGTFHLLNKADIRTQKYEGKSPMPADYSATLSKAELGDLVSFLIRAASADKGNQGKNADDDYDE